MSKQSSEIFLTFDELIFLSKILDHQRLYIKQQKKGKIGQDHQSSKRTITGAIYLGKSTNIFFSARELGYLKNLVFQYFLTSIRIGLIDEDLKFSEIYNKICKSLNEPPNELLTLIQKMKLKKYVLIIDDEPIVCQNIKNEIQMVFGNDFNYEMANSAEEALEIIPELIDELDILVTISDWMMPGMKGDDFLIELHKIVPDAVKIMVTGHADQRAIQRAYMEASLHQVIRKPWKENEIIEAIKRHLPKK